MKFIVSNVEYIHRCIFSLLVLSKANITLSDWNTSINVCSLLAFVLDSSLTSLNMIEFSLDHRHARGGRIYQLLRYEGIWRG
jgi:hypothetical protein